MFSQLTSRVQKNLAVFMTSPDRRHAIGRTLQPVLTQQPLCHACFGGRRGERVDAFVLCSRLPNVG